MAGVGFFRRGICAALVALALGLGAWPAQAGTTTYTYDALGRLTGSFNTATGIGVAYTYDAAGNRTQVVVGVQPVTASVSAIVAQNSSANPITLSLSGGTPTSVAVSTAAGHGTATASGTSITYTPTSGYTGADSFAYTASNASGTSAPATVSITVMAHVVAGTVTATVAQSSTNNIITLNLSGGPVASVAVSTAAGHGTATASGTTITYTPTTGYTGSDSFAYTATNAVGTSSPATASITVSSSVGVWGAFNWGAKSW
jgi:carbon monoxide dehydrogenase subunit G